MTLTDINGVVRTDRPNMLPNMARYARDTRAQTLEDALPGADIFLGLSAPRVLKQEFLALLADKPLIMALANPDPEISPDTAREERPDAIVATGRSDYPNQVNNVLCFPFIFRGALDVSAREINEEMKIAAVEAISALARMEASEVVAAAYGGTAPLFGPEYIIPKPFDPRLILEIAPAVAQAAMETGVARRPIADFNAYRRDLERFVFRSGQLMRPVFEAARAAPQRIVYAEGEDERVLRAAQTLMDDRIALPILIGDRDVIRRKAHDMGLRMDLTDGVRVLDPRRDTDVFAPLLPEYQRLAGRRGIPLDIAERSLNTRNAVAAAMLLRAGEADAAICGGAASWWRQVQYILPIIPRRPDVTRVYALACLILPSGTLFLCDTHMVLDPTSEQVAEMTRLAAEAVEEFGIQPKIALLSHSNFGGSNSDPARKMRRALALIRAQSPDLEIEGEMNAESALIETIRNRAIPDSALAGSANLLVMPTLDAANIAFTLLKAASDALPVGPMLLGMSKPIHVLVSSVTARGIVNLSAFAAREALTGRPGR